MRESKWYLQNVRRDMISLREDMILLQNMVRLFNLWVGSFLVNNGVQKIYKLIAIAKKI